MQWSALAIAAKQRADIATKAALEAEREKDAALKELERLQRQGRTDAAQDLQINGRAVEETSPLDIITVKEEDPGAPLLLGEVVEVAPQPTPPPPPKLTVPTELKGWNYFLFVGSTAFLLVNAGFVNAVGLKATGSTNSHYTGVIYILMYICTCMYMYTCACVCARARARMYVCVCMCMFVCIHTYVYTHTHTYIHTCIHTDIYIHTHTHTHTHTHSHIQA
jgi:hypothetical protein